MRVLLIDVNCKGSSTGKIVYDLYKRLIRDGHEAAVCFGRGEIIDETNIYKFGYDWETFLHAGLARVTGINGYFSWYSTDRLIKYIKFFQPDVIHIHELHAYFVNHLQLINFIRESGIKVVWTFHCEYMYTGKCGYAYDCNRFQKGCGKCPLLSEYPKSLFFDFTKKMFKDKCKVLQELDFKIVTPSKWLADRVRESFLREKEILVVHNGVDTSLFLRRNQTIDLRNKFSIQQKNIIIGVAPNIMEERKGGEYLLSLSKRLDPEEYFFALIGTNETQRIEKNVLLVAKTKSQQELVEWYNLASVFVICSEKETFSMTCAEALCCGTPVVGFKSGAPETIFQEPYAHFVNYGNEEALCLSIKKACESDWNREDIERYAKCNFSSEKMYLDYLNKTYV